MLRIECIYTNLLYIMHIPVCVCVRLCFPSTGQLIFIMDARFVPCEVGVKSRNVKCLVERVVLGPGFLFPHYFHFHLSLLFHQCSKFICVFMLLISEGQAADFWKPSKKQCTFGRVEYWITTFKMFLIFKW